MEKGKKVCPLCDYEMDADAKSCPNCDVDLTIFDVDKDGKLEFDDINIEDTKSLDDLLAEISKSGEISTDIVEDLKSIGKTSTTVEHEAVAPESPPPQAVPGVPPKPGVPPQREVAAPAVEETFECPQCGVKLPYSANVCFNCGVEFVQETEQFECPECGTLINADAKSCPSCKVEFIEEGALEVPSQFKEVPEERPAEKLPEPEAVPAKPPEKPTPAPPKEPEPKVDQRSLYKNLQDLVEEVKPLLLIAKRYSIEVAEGRDLIGKAIEAGRKKNITEALECVRGSKVSVEKLLSEHIAEQIIRLKANAEEARAQGIKIDLGASIEAASNALRIKDFETAMQSFMTSKKAYERSSGAFADSKSELDAMRDVAESLQKLDMDPSAVKRYIEKVMAEFEKSDWKKASRVAADNKAEVFKNIKAQVEKEIKKVRTQLVEWKAQDREISRLVVILKDIGDKLKGEDSLGALRQMGVLKTEIDKM